VNALGRVDPWHTRHLFVKLLGSADSRIFVAAVTQLAICRDHELSRLFMKHLTDPAFERRPAVERRALYRAVAETGGDEVVPDLEAELHRGNWFNRNAEEHRGEIARCLAGIGTGDARRALDRGLLSRRGPVRTACEAALAWIQEHGRHAA
jgi:HEAT repeat protein